MSAAIAGQRVERFGGRERSSSALRREVIDQLADERQNFGLGQGLSA